MMDFLIQKAYAAGASGPDTISVGASGPDVAAQGGSVDFNSLFSKILTNIAQPLISLLIALAVAYFVWGVLVFIQNADNPEKRKDGYNHMFWGIIGIFIMVSVTGIINLIKSTIGIH